VKRLHLWLEQTHGPFFELVRHFLTDLFQNDWVSSREHLQVFAGTLLGMVTMSRSPN